MKRLFAVLGVGALLAILGGLGYIVYDRISANNAPLGDAMSVSRPGQGTQGSGGGVLVNTMKHPETDADVLDALVHEMTQNDDTVGWITVPGTEINASVVQGINNTYYLRRDERKQDALYGCYFADYTNNFGSKEQLSTNTVIYGHSDLTDNPDGPKFSQLFRFTEEEFARKHPTITFAVDGEQMTWEIFAVYYTDLKFDFTKTDLDAAALAAYVQGAKARSLYQYDVEVSASDKVITLVTCTIKYGVQNQNQRFVVAARLLPTGAAAPTKAALEVNPAPKQPGK